MLSRGREGEDEAMVKVRLEQYYEHTFPIVEAFRKHTDIVEIDASQSIDAIATEYQSIVL